MAHFRKLQRIKGQYSMSVPVSIIREKGWQKGDWLKIADNERGAFELQKVATTRQERDKVELEMLTAEAACLFAHINSGGADADFGMFSGRLAQFSHIQAKMRRLRNKLAPPQT